ncbi:hypothetical protein GPALN_010684 [Globodera pallida]|nr:hypothetical protein GPALN_010684 [Globodera pallida]
MICVGRNLRVPFSFAAPWQHFAQQIANLSPIPPPFQCPLRGRLRLMPMHSKVVGSKQRLLAATGCAGGGNYKMPMPPSPKSACSRLTHFVGDGKLMMHKLYKIQTTTTVTAFVFGENVGETFARR